MGYDAVVDRAELDSAITATAEAIREKLGSTDPMLWDPDTGFQTAVNAIDLSKQANAVEDGFLLGTYANIDNDRVTSITSNALRNMPGLKTVKVDIVTTIGEFAMYSCTALTKVHAPKATTLRNGIFYGDTRLVDVDLTAAETIGNNVFYACRALTTLKLPAITSIGDGAFNGCSVLTKLIIGTAGCTLGTNAFTGTPFANGSGTIYIPSGSYDSFYKEATNWSALSSQRFVEYTNIEEVPT